MGIPTKRPDDYFAEMVKTDRHMQKVKRKMIHQQQEILESEDRRKQKANKKFGKQVQRETPVARAQKRKREIAVHQEVQRAQMRAAERAMDALATDAPLYDKIRRRTREAGVEAPPPADAWDNPRGPLISR